MPLERPAQQIIFIWGPPGAGKGSLCSKLSSKFGFIHLSVGELLRREIESSGSEYGELLRGFVEDGKVTPVEVTCRIVDRAMEEKLKVFDGQEKVSFDWLNLVNSNAIFQPTPTILIDGYPRNLENLHGFLALLPDSTKTLAIHLNSRKSTCKERCLKRSRSDDDQEKFEKRWKTYLDETVAVMTHFEQHCCVHQVNAELDLMEIFENVCRILKVGSNYEF
jgi:UMP-CMP kinase